MKLTQTVKKGGCAAKVPAMILREILAGVTFPPKIEGLTVDGAGFDDAAIYKISETHSLVQTLDFFTPIVDDPFDFGAVAAANSLSDVYAMGGKPKTCMAILAAPLATMEPSVIQSVLQGASSVIAEAKASLVGGHSIDDDTLKFGLSVTGVVDNDSVWTNAGAKVGDYLILTKPLGTGTICAGIKKQEVEEAFAEEAVTSMKRLNNVIDLLSLEEISSIHAATDITGFGLAGHGYQLAKASDKTLAINFKGLPLFQGTMKCLERGWLTKAHRSNEEYTRSAIEWAETISETERLVAFDPQTSGGLLLSVSPAYAKDIVERISTIFPGTTVIGTVMEKQDVHVIME
ncbi:MAG: selenide, water dikinase SelD [Bacteriovoracaceae bacterium]